MIKIEGLTKSYGGQPVLQDIDLDGEARRVPRRARPQRRRQVDAAALHQPPDAARRRRDRDRRHGVRRRTRRACGCCGRVAMIFQHHNLVKRLSVLKNVLVGRMAGLSSDPRSCSSSPKRTSRSRWNASARVELAHKANVAHRPALGRRAAARRHRPRAGAAAEGHPGRRAGGQPRPEDLAHRARLSQGDLQGRGHHGDLQPAPGRLRAWSSASASSACRPARSSSTTRRTS